MTFLWTVVEVATSAAINLFTWLINVTRRKIEYPNDTVIVHQMGRARYAPSLSPFPIKLETYLRFAKIPYVNADSFENSPKGKVPWIEFNGEVVSDSSFIIEFLNKKINVDLSKHLSPPERATARAFQKMAEENLYWTLAYTRWLDENSTQAKLHPKGFFWERVVPITGKRNARENMYGHGIGRHSESEIYRIAEKDIRALSAFLGNKKFLFGDEPCEEDCAIFGQLAHFVWQLEGSPQETLVNGDCSNLRDYCYAMKERFWPDWDRVILGERELPPYELIYPETDSTVFRGSP